MSSGRERAFNGKEPSLGLDKEQQMKSSSGSGSNLVDCTQTFLVCYCSLPAPLKTFWTPENSGRRFWGCANYDSNRKAACRFFKWMDKPIYERSMKVIPALLVKIKELENENVHLLAMVKDFESERDDLQTDREGYIARVNQLEKDDDRQLEIVAYIENEKDMYRAREKFIMFGLLLSWLIIVLIGIIAIIK